MSITKRTVKDQVMVCKAQLGFIAFLVAPAYDLYCKYWNDPFYKELVDGNIAHWEGERDAVLAAAEKEKEKEKAKETAAGRRRRKREKGRHEEFSKPWALDETKWPLICQVVQPFLHENGCCLDSLLACM